MTVNQHFRLMSVEFDPDEEVTAVRAQADPEAYGLITERFFVGVKTVDTAKDGSRLIELRTEGIVKLHDVTGKIPGTDPIYPLTTEIWSSLCIVVNGLMEDW